MRKKGLLRPPQLQQLILSREEEKGTGVKILISASGKGKGRFGKRATPIDYENYSSRLYHPFLPPPHHHHLHHHHSLEDSSNDSGFECDWNSQSESQFAWSYNSNTSSSNSHHGTAAEDSNHSTKSAPGGCISIPKFPYLEGGLSSEGASGKRLSNLAQHGLIESTSYSSSSSSSSDDLTLDSSAADLKLLQIVGGKKALLSPGKTTMSPGRGPTEPLGGRGGANNTNASTTPASAAAPSPVKRPRLCFSPPASDPKGSGLKLRNQNGTHGNNVRGIGKRLPPGTIPTLTSPLTASSRDGRVHLQILSQPEEQHRARYQTEGSRGAIKDRKCNGFPTVKLFGYDKPATLQIFIGTDQGKVSPHMFYQACKVTGKSSTPCIEKTVEGTIVIEIEFEPSKEMVISCDCVGILKARNVDVEQRFPFHHASAAQSRKKSTKCRMVFRTTIVNSLGHEETLQAASLPILCTQPPGQPEICKQSLYECPANGGKEIFVVGKNFLKDSSVVIQEESQGGEVVWETKVSPQKDYLQQTHLICTLPSYKDETISAPVDCKISIWSGGKLSEPHRLTYVPNISSTASVMGLVSSAAMAAALPDSPSRTLSSVQQLTINSVSGPEMQHAVEMQVPSVAAVVSPEHLVGSAIVSPAQVSCHMSPTSSMDSPVLASQMCSPVDQSLTMLPHSMSSASTSPLAAPISTFESSIMTSLPTTQSSYSTTVDELKTLLEQSAAQDHQQQQQQQQQQQAITTVTATTLIPVVSDVKQEVLLSPSMMEPTTTMTTTMASMPFQGESSMAAGTTATATTTTGGFSTGAQYPVDPILTSVTLQQPLMNSPPNLSPIATMVNENSQHSLLPPQMTLAHANVVTGPTTMEGLIAAAATVNQVPMTLTQTSIGCMEPILKTEQQQQQQQQVQVCQPTVQQQTVAMPTAVGAATTTGSQPTTSGSVVFINNELQGHLTNALAQMSDNELLNYINPSCFDQGSF